MDVLNILKIITTLIFFTRASIEDIKTTEIRDFEVYFFISILLFLNVIQFFLTGDSKLIYNLVLNIIIFGGFGFLLYFLGQWGLGDSFLLLSFGLLNFFKNFLQSIRWLLIIFSVGVYFIFSYSVMFILVTRKFHSLKFFSKVSLLLSSLILILSLLFSIKARTVEFLICFLIFLYSSIPFLQDMKTLMIKKVPIRKIKEGDVLLDFKIWRGITKKEINQLRRRGIKYVYIKEGVRYAPTFLFVLILLIFEFVFSKTTLEFFPLEDLLTSWPH